MKEMEIAFHTGYNGTSVNNGTNLKCNKTMTRPCLRFQIYVNVIIGFQVEIVDSKEGIKKKI